jgi:hypothetical protein
MSILKPGGAWRSGRAFLSWSIWGGEGVAGGLGLACQQPPPPEAQARQPPLLTAPHVHREKTHRPFFRVQLAPPLCHLWGDVRAAILGEGHRGRQRGQQQRERGGPCGAHLTSHLCRQDKQLLLRAPVCRRDLAPFWRRGSVVEDAL